MGNHERLFHRSSYQKPMPSPRQGAPLDFIHDDHLREREICALIDQIAEGPDVFVQLIQTVLDFLTTDLPLHLRDEEEDLFPLLKRRCKPEDEISKVIARLHRDHAHANEDTPQIVAVLQTLIETPRALTPTEKSLLTAYAGHARRHLILENAIILPFARLRLTAGDLETLNIRMCQRRSLNHLRTAKT